MNHADVYQECHLLLWKESFQSATYLFNLAVVEVDKELNTRHDHFEEKFPKLQSSFEYSAKLLQ